MNGFRITGVLLLALTAALCCTAAFAEAPGQPAEQGVSEIQDLLEIANVEDREGMSLEEMTDAVTESVMSEYVDSETGFSMQYPSVFLFDESGQGTFALTEDQRAMMSIDNLENQGQLTEEMLLEAIRFETPDVNIIRNEQNGCIRVDRMTDDGRTNQTDLYLLTDKSFHHIMLRYPDEEKETYRSYIEYMINTMAAESTDLG